MPGPLVDLSYVKLYEGTKEAFRLAVPDLVPGPDFLEAFARLGCYLDDLCLKPVNHLSLDIASQRARRRRHREEGEEALARRIRDMTPSVLIIAMKGIQENVRRALLAANLDAKIPAPALPFPARHRQRYVQELGSLLKELRRGGIVKPPCG